MEYVFRFLCVVLTILSHLHQSLASYDYHEVRTTVDRNGANVKVSYTYTKQSYKKWGQVWNSYRKKTVTHYNCVTGWVSQYGKYCNIPLCGTIPAIADPCPRPIPSGYIAGASGWVTSSGGKCVRPDTCEGCVTGAYSTGPYCKYCPQISNCDLEVCTNQYSSTCQRCASDYGNCFGCKAYLNGGTSCDALCSWKSSSTLCYPGTCGSQGLNSACTCSRDFTTDGQTRCGRVSKSPALNSFSVKLRTYKDQTITQNDPNSVGVDQTIWSSLDTAFYPHNVQVSFMTEFVHDGAYPARPEYITDFKVGVESLSVKHSYFLSTNGEEKNLGSEYYESIDNSQDGNYGQYAYEGNGRVPLAVVDGFRIQVVAKSTSAGIMEVKNLDTDNTEVKQIIGATTKKKFSIIFDIVLPFSKDPTNSFTIGNDVFRGPTVLIASWKDWKDTRSGLKEFTVEIIPLTIVGDQLQEDGSAVLHKTYSASDSPTRISVDFVGMHSVIFTAYDNAGNYQSARRLFLQTEPTTITTKPESKLQVVSSTHLIDGKTWQNDLTGDITVDFKDRYVNLDIKNKGWTLPVKPYPNIAEEYDDLEGKRTIRSTGSIEGIQSARVGFIINEPSKSPTPIEWKLADLGRGREGIQANKRVDGCSVDIYVEVADFTDNKLSESVRVYIDSSPPVIKNLWLTRDGVNDLAVHNAEEFYNMSFEWEALDPDSGVNTVSWVLFDNYTDIIVHGRQDVGNQGQYNDLDDCKASMAVDGVPDCYCTPYSGCFHRNFHITPEISKDNGWDPNNSAGNHDADYFIEVTVQNRAGLVATEVKKITIDASPPRAGHIYDSRPGFLDIDFQFDTTVHANWDGFFDRESGVKEYQYVWGTTCATSDRFGPDKTDISRTTSKHFSYTVPGPGKYYVSVVALNRALSASDVVCSNGIVIDTTYPIIEDIIVQNTLRRPGLIKSNNTVYFVKTNGYRVLIKTQAQDCIDKATPIDVEDFPRELDENNTIVSEPASFCDDKIPFSNSDVTLLTRDNYIAVNWTGYDEESMIKEFFVSISTTMNAEDIMPETPTGTGGVGYFKAYHPGLEEGQRFYINIHAVNLAAMQNTVSRGPFVVELTGPSFSGAVTPFMYNGDLFVAWNQHGFTNGDDADPFTYSFAIGTTKGGWDITKWQDLDFAGNCTKTTAPSCSRVYTQSSPFKLHSGETYFVSIKADTYIKLTAIATSGEVRHFTDKPAPGVVMDNPPPGEGEVVQFGRSPDIDSQVTTTALSVWWYGFERPYHPTTYSVCVGTTPGGADVVGFTFVEDKTEFIFADLKLNTSRTYYMTVKAKNPNGETSVTSDGVTVLKAGASISIKINDDLTCLGIGGCVSEDLDYMVSRSSLSASWIIPDEMKPFIRNVYWGIEQQRDVIDTVKWDEFEPFLDLKMSDHIIKPGLAMISGRRYRSVVKFCSGAVCFSPVYSDGVLIEANAPAPGNNMTISLRSDNKTIDVLFDKFEDIDIPDDYIELARSLVDRYQWTVSYDTGSGEMMMQWTDAVVRESSPSKWAMTVQLTTVIDPKTCPELVIRGYTKAGMYSSVKKDILQNCGRKDADVVVYDAVGLPETINTGNRLVDGLPITYEKDTDYTKEDQDYTRYTNILSAVWPKLENNQFTFAVIHDETIDAFDFYGPVSKMKLMDPCSHPNSIHCGKTDDQFANVMFEPGDIKDGKRYFFCITADAVTRFHGSWTENIPAVQACSDGVNVDLSPPTMGNVWVGFNRSADYVTTHTELFIIWDHFNDMDESDQAYHHNGIMYYEYGIGSHFGETDIVGFTNVGMAHHARLHQLELQQGHTYFATIRGTDFVGLTSQTTASGVTIDTSPPTTTESAIKYNNSYLTSTKAVSASWDNIFIDNESGVTFYQWAVGSRDGYADIMPYTETSQQFGETSEDIDLKLQEGHSYYISVKAFNGAGLSTLIYSWATTVDASSPIAGQVYDGKRGDDATRDATNDRKDQDYQTDPSRIWASWDEFQDPHSFIVAYSWAVGSCPSCTDVLDDHYVGAIQSASADDLVLHPGLTYYVTVTACNGAGMCTSASSDGIIIDVTPPVPGVVKDGVESEDINFQASRNFIGAKWWGFTDPQSGILHYSWWIGTTSGGDDIVEQTILHQHEMAYLLSLPERARLPVKQKIYITVRATNHAGLSSQATSNGFKIDSTPPLFEEEPEITDDVGSIAGGTQIAQTFISVEWVVSEADSYIEEIFLTISSSIQSELPSSSSTVRLEGNHMPLYTFTNLMMKDGNYYYVNVKACNAAKMCSDRTSRGILVDATPPSIGTFAIDTSSAADLVRVPTDGPTPMSWSVEGIYLAWVGFADLHSGIQGYQIMVGTTFEARDVALQTFEHQTKEENADLYETDEGVLQVGHISGLTRALEPNMHIYVQIIAINKAGLRSYPLNKKFRLLDGGTMFLVRRCGDADTCLGHCTCAQEDSLCPSQQRCEELDRSTFNVIFSDITTLRLDMEPRDLEERDFTRAKAFLAASWQIDVEANPIVPIRYDWSIGLAGRSEPTGVFHGNEIIWHDAGQDFNAVHTMLDPARFFDFDVKYSFYLRAWKDYNSYATYITDGITIDNTRPQLGTQMAAEVKDCDETLGVYRDVDYYSRTDVFCVSWKGRFIEVDGGIQMIGVAFGTYPGGQDVMEGRKIYTNEDVYQLGGLSLVTGQRYYGTVAAMNMAGLVSVQYSDGVIIDTIPPVAGAVFDGFGLHDTEYQNLTGMIGAHWNGFVDLESYIDHYFWCIGLDSEDPEECTVMGWKNVGLKTRATVTEGLEGLAEMVQHQTEVNKVYNKVYAVDAAGLKSRIVVSDGVAIDVTPPKIVSKLQFGPNQLMNPSFEEDRDEDVSLGVPSGWTAVSDAVCGIYQDIRLAKTGSQFVVLFGGMYQILEELEVGERYRLVFFASHIYPSVSSSLTTQAKVGLPDGSEYVIELGKRISRGDNEEDAMTTSWDKFVFYFVAASRSGKLTVSTMGEINGVVFDDFTLEQTMSGERSISDGFLLKNFTTPIHAHAIFSHDWNYVQIAWEFEDSESPIVDYTWALGNGRGRNNLLDYTSVGRNTAARTSDLDLRHATAVYATIIATNAAGLKTTLLSDAINLDLTKPVCDYVYDGESELDIDYQKSYTIKAHWNCHDSQSGIQRCYYGIGSAPGAANIRNLTDAGPGQNSLEVTLEPPPATPTVYVTVRCWNYAGESASASSDGVTIVTKPPMPDGSNVVQILTPSDSVYPLRGAQHRLDQVLMKLGGFRDPYGVSGFQVRIVGENIWSNGFQDIENFCTNNVYVLAYNLEMKQGEYRVVVRAENMVRDNSREVEVTFKVVDLSLPQIKPYSAGLFSRWANSTDGEHMGLYISWKGVFKSRDSQTLVYEVSIGSTKGGADILQWQETTNDHINVNFPDGQFEEWFVVITAISPDGFSKMEEFYIAFPQD